MNRSCGTPKRQTRQQLIVDLLFVVVTEVQNIGVHPHAEPWTVADLLARCQIIANHLMPDLGRKSVQQWREVLVPVFKCARHDFGRKLQLFGFLNL
jgi:hypothetical protein